MTPDLPTSSVASVVRGVWLLARGRGEGMNCFRGGTDSLVAAMMPSIALVLVVSCLQLLQGPSARELTNLLLILAALLTRLVLTQALAARWSRQGLWTRYAAASLWCEWAPYALSLVANLVLRLCVPEVAGSRGGAIGVLIVIEAYDLWLSWFVARSGLVLKRGQAALLVGAVLAASIALYVVAAMLPPHFNLWAELTTPAVVHG